MTEWLRCVTQAKACPFLGSSHGCMSAWVRIPFLSFLYYAVDMAMLLYSVCIRLFFSIKTKDRECQWKVYLFSNSDCFVCTRDPGWKSMHVKHSHRYLGRTTFNHHAASSWSDCFNLFAFCIISIVNYLTYDAQVIVSSWILQLPNLCSQNYRQL